MDQAESFLRLPVPADRCPSLPTSRSWLSAVAVFARLGILVKCSTRGAGGVQATNFGLGRPHPGQI